LIVYYKKNLSRGNKEEEMKGGSGTGKEPLARERCIFGYLSRGSWLHELRHWNGIQNFGIL